MAQSVELLLDERAEAAIRQQWDLLAAAGLPSEAPPGGRHAGADAHRRPHVTLFAADAVPEVAEDALPELLAGVDLELWVGALMVFGPRRGRVILVRQVTPSVELLRLQRRVAEACHAAVDGQFGSGRWSPHLTLARRLPTERLGVALEALGRTADRPVPAQVTRCRRWDGARRTAWLV